MHPQPSTAPRAPRRRFTAFASYGLLLASCACLLTACPQAAPPPPPEPSPTPVPTATPVASATPTMTPIEVAKYSGQQQMAYNRQAVDEFVGQRAEKSQPYIEAHNALETAGSVGAKGLTAKEAIAARRDLVAKCSAANDVYLDFVKTQEDTYRADLAKTPLLPGDIDALVKDFADKANTAAIIKLRETERETLKAGDDMLVGLDKSFGDWSVNGAGALTFKKKGGAAAYGAAAQKYNKLATEESQMLAEVNKAAAVPSSSATPTASPAAAGPSPSATPTASPAP